MACNYPISIYRGEVVDMTIPSDFGYDISSLGLYTTNSEYIEYIDDFEVVDDSIVFTLDTATLDLLSDGVIKYKIDYADTTSEESNTNYILKTPDTYSARTSEDFYEEGYEKGYKEGVGSKLVPVIERTIEELTSEDLSGLTYLSNIFVYSKSLKKIELPDGLETIETSALGGCTNLKEVSVPGSVSVIPMHFVDTCLNLEKVVLNPGIKTIDTLAFDKCNSLSSLTLSEGLETINKFAFQGITKLAEIIIPSTVTFMGEMAINIPNLQRLIVLAETPPSKPSGVSVYPNRYPVYVPDSSVDAYKSAWESHADWIKPMSELSE